MSLLDQLLLLREILAILSVIYAYRTTRRIGWSIRAAAIFFMIESLPIVLLRAAMLLEFEIPPILDEGAITLRAIANFLGIYYVFRAVEKPVTKLR